MIRYQARLRAFVVVLMVLSFSWSARTLYPSGPLRHARNFRARAISGHSDRSGGIFRRFSEQASAVPNSGSANAQDPQLQQGPNRVQQSQPIRVSVDRVNVGVLVTDPAGKFVEGLQRENFHVFDNGVEQSITDFLAVEEPAQALVLIEAGPAVYLLEAGHLQAAHAFLSGLSPDDRVAVVKYADAPQPLIDFTADKQSAAAAFDDLRFNLGFGSLNLSASLSKVLDWLAAVRGKKTIVLLSTGVETSSTKEIQDLLQRLKTSDVRILAVSLTGNLRNPSPGAKKKTPSTKAAVTSQQFAEADMLLRQIAETTGGLAYFPSSPQELSAIFAQIAQIVRHEFSLAFAPATPDGAIHSLDVRVTAGAADVHSTSMYRVDYRHAYLAPPPANP
jgi:Ca-activated chloride channel homolog